MRVRLSALARMSNTPGRLSIASFASWLCRTHRRDSIFVDFNHVPSRFGAAREASEASRASRDDRMGVGAGLDHVILFDLLVEERVEAVLARAEGVDLTHQHEYRKSGFSELLRLSRFNESVYVGILSCRA